MSNTNVVMFSEPNKINKPHRVAPTPPSISVASLKMPSRKAPPTPQPPTPPPPTPPPPTSPLIHQLHMNNTSFDGSTKWSAAGRVNNPFIAVLDDFQSEYNFMVDTTNNCVKKAKQVAKEQFKRLK